MNLPQAHAWGFIARLNLMNTEFFKRIRFQKEHLMLSFCLFLGLIFTFENIGLLDFWLDEAGVYIAVKKPFWEIGKATIAYSQQLSHNYGVKAWSLIFGYGPTAMRGFSVFCFLALIWMMYKAGTYFFQKKEVGLLAAFITATNYFAIWYAIQVKAYALAALVGLLSFYFFVKSVREPGWKSYLPYFVFSALGFYAHPWLILIFGSQIISILIFRKHYKKVFQILTIQFLIFLASIPFIIISLEQGRLGVNTYIEKVYWWRIFESFSFLSYGSSWAYLGITLATLFFLAGKSPFIKRMSDKIVLGYVPENESYEKKEGPLDGFQKEERRMNIMIIFYLMVPMAAALAVSQFKPAYMVGRYEMTVLPALILILANLWLKIKEKIWLYLVVILLLFFALKNVIAFRENNGSYRSTDRTVVEDIYTEGKNGDYIVSTQLSWATAYYYSNRLASEKKINLVPYPRKMPDQAVWINWEEVNNPDNWGKFSGEADAIVEKIKNDPNASQIFVLYKSGSPVNEILKEKLDQNFDFIKEDYPELPREASWFDYVIIYQKR
jgi:hypothetical protein